ncbi:hypothetical protein [Streptomyces sp. NPDC093984]|uniref:hypothetical protein n=1 Tax=Streptomyces sp. NPDC093984 TaxID=3366052 RepID=UPI0038171242
MSWAWEYVPDEETVTAGAPRTFLTEVEKKAAELVRAAEALHLQDPLTRTPRVPSTRS